MVDAEQRAHSAGPLLLAGARIVLPHAKLGDVFRHADGSQQFTHAAPAFACDASDKAGLAAGNDDADNRRESDKAEQKADPDHRIRAQQIAKRHRAGRIAGSLVVGTLQ